MKKHYTTLELEKEQKQEKNYGTKETKKEIIKRMLKENFDKNIIKEITNATDEEIEEAKMAK